jgi:hypothetical protein
MLGLLRELNITCSSRACAVLSVNGDGIRRGAVDNFKGPGQPPRVLFFVSTAEPQGGVPLEGLVLSHHATACPDMESQEIGVTTYWVQPCVADHGRQAKCLVCLSLIRCEMDAKSAGGWFRQG